MHDGSWLREKRRKIVGPGPHACFFCKKMIAGRYVVHHVDGDHLNDSPGNLAAAHSRCHNSHHMKGNKRRAGKVLTAEHRAAISRANIGNKHTTGRTLTMEHRRKISAAFQRRREGKVS